MQLTTVVTKIHHCEFPANSMIPDLILVSSFYSMLERRSLCVPPRELHVPGWVDHPQRQPGDGVGSVPPRAVFSRRERRHQQEVEDEEHDGRTGFLTFFFFYVPRKGQRRVEKTKT